ncbi:MAG: FAD-dependent oxidoreductase [Elusimicrobia bacterium]|nr:MAG: FAD-dependent oxidoreductase [Elusimicrobiota bacterium]
MEKVDVAIIGSGVIGLAIAARIARKNRTVVVLESHRRYGVETSSRNSEVIHAGIYYPAGSLKSRLCHEGRRSLYALAEKTSSLFVRKTGKLIVATNDEEAQRLTAIREGALASGAEGIMLLSGDQARQRIPALKTVAALWCPESGIVDSEDYMRYFHTEAEEKGAMFLFGNKVSSVEQTSSGYNLSFGEKNERLHARIVINAAGLHGDKIAEMAGFDIEAAGYRIHWCKGLYYRVRGELSLPHLVYPVPTQYGLGIHLTMDREGRVRLGPDTEFVDRIDYEVPAERASVFRDVVARYWSGSEIEDLTPDTAGIRPKLSGPDGDFRDFVIEEESAKGFSGWVNCLGIESPGLTASSAISERVAGFVE